MSVFVSSRRMTQREQTAYQLGYDNGKREQTAYQLGYDNGKYDAVRHGEWKPTYHAYYNRDGVCQIADEWHCSECGCFSADRRNYCPNCGAKMRGKTE